MMYSDYLALSVCAFSVLCLPFMVICQLRFSHVLQAEGFETNKYFRRIKRNLPISFFPLLGICAIAVIAEGALNAYLYNTYLYDNELLVGYFAAIMLVCIAAAAVFFRYIRCIKLECSCVAPVCSQRFSNVFLLSVMLLGATVTLGNVILSINKSLLFVPLLTPFFVPLSNLILGYGKAAQKA